MNGQNADMLALARQLERHSQLTRLGFDTVELLNKAAAAILCGAEERAAEPVTDVPAQGSADPVAALIEETECADVDDLRDMANVGKALMEAIANLIKSDGPFKDWAPAQCPSEIVFDLANALGDALAEGMPAEERETLARALEVQLHSHSPLTLTSVTVREIIAALRSTPHSPAAKEHLVGLDALRKMHDRQRGPGMPPKIIERPRGSNADEWNAFLEEKLGHGNSYLAVQIAEAIEDAERHSQPETEPQLPAAVKLLSRAFGASCLPAALRADVAAFLRAFTSTEENNAS